MTDTDRLRLAIAQDLREIAQLYTHLDDEAIHHADDQEFPGGEALNLAAPAATTANWQDVFDQLEASGEDLRYANDQVAERHVLLVLGDWEDRIRHERSQPTRLRVTVPRAVDYLRGSLGWITEHFNDADLMARELRSCRAALENVLSDGVRHDASAAACFRDTLGEDGSAAVCGGRLVRYTLDRDDCRHAAAAADSAKGVLDAADVLRRMLREFPELEREHRSCDQGGRDDVYRCQRCGGYYTEAEYWLAVKQHYEQVAG